MTIDQNNPQWTAYAFDELEANERTVIEADLRENPEAQQFVEELRLTGELLKSALAKEPAASLTAQQRASLTNAINGQPIAVGSVAPLPKPNRHRRHWIAALAAVAATGLIAAVLLPAIQRARESQKVAKKDSTTSDVAKSAPAQGIQFTGGSSRVHLENGVDRPLPTRSSTLVEDAAQVGHDVSRPEQHRRINMIAPSHTSSNMSNDGLPPELREGNANASATLSGPPTDRPTGQPYLNLLSGDRSSNASTDGQTLASPSFTVAKPLYEGQPGSDSYIVTKPVREPSKDINGKPATPESRSGSDAGGLIGPTQIEFLEGLDQIVIRGNPQDVEKAIARIKEVEARRDGKQATPEEFIRALHGRGEAQVAAETYDLPPENAFEPVSSNPLSTFSIDVDTASYANIRRFLIQNNQLPPPAAVRIEEMLNYFRYEYPQPEGDVPFSVTTEVATCPWNTDHRLVRVGLKGKEIAKNKRPVSNLVFLLDVSGSMQDANKLPLVREAMKMLVRELSENDRVAIVVYAGASGMVLDSTTADQKDLIIAAIDQLQAGGSTNGAGGIQQAYDVAMQHFIKGGTNRVILATDGDFNVGITDRGQLVKLIEDKAKSGVFLTTLGFGMGNLKDATLEQLADKGNGNYAYVDTLAEARKIFVEEMMGTLVTIAKDVKVQIEFNPAEVASYRLIGYENRKLAAEDFNDDKKDAGEIGAGHTVTALYELVPVGKSDGAANASRPADASGQTAETPAGIDPLRYQKPTAPKTELTDAANNGELFTLKLRYKQPDGDTSKLIEHPVKDSGKAYREASGDFKFAASVAAFGMTLRHSQHRGTITLDGIKELAQEGRSFDPSGYRSEFVTLIEKAQSLGAK